jgi:hypothetical protein
MESSLYETETQLMAAVVQGVTPPPGYALAIEETVSVRPAWKEVALSLGADEDIVRAQTSPTVSKKLVVSVVGP